MGPTPVGPVVGREPSAATVTIYPDGPLVVRGDFEIRQADGTTVPTGRIVALCRCGRSAVKPLCDGGHKRRRRCAAPADLFAREAGT